MSRTPVKIDGQFHDYVLDLASSLSWRGTITILRFDACRNAPGEKVEIEESRLRDRSQ